MRIDFGGAIALVVIALIILGIIFIPKLIRGESVALRMPHFNKRDKKATGPEPNSINIYPDKVVFEYVKKPLGMAQQCLNDSKEYYVQEYDPVNNKMKEWALPDSNEDARYYDPKEFANVVTMPCSKKYLEWTPNTFQKIAFGIMAVIIGVEIIGLVIFTG